jgi:dolichyl-phosphate-mannose-protein mannosyltransferase
VTATGVAPVRRTQGRRTQGLSRTAQGRPVPSVRRRFSARTGRSSVLGDRLAGWLVAFGVTALAGVLRFWRLGHPNQLLFDETYYAKDGWSLWLFGYGRNWVEKADTAIERGRYSPGLIKPDPQMTVHPDVGKWLIGAGEQLFGLDPFGWRFASAVVGTLMVLVMVRLVRRLTGSTLLGGVAGLLLCFDGLQFVLSRLALLDIFVAFFLLCAVSCLVADRDWGRARLLQLTGGVADGWGPVRGLLWRPWRLAAAVMLGLAVGSKWSAVVPVAGLGLLVLAWDAGARRALGVRLAWWRSALVDGVPAFLTLVGVGFLVYVATWAGWLTHAHVYEVALSDNQYGLFWGAYTRHEAHGFSAVTQGLRSLWHYHHDLWEFHRNGLRGAEHSYQSDPAGWLLLNRPVGVAADLGIRPGRQGCDAPTDSTCLRQVLLLGTPALWWGGAAALLYAGYAWVLRRDWRAGLVVVGVLTTWVPFFPNADRPIFSFYAITTLPFTIIAVCLVLGRLLGPAAPTRRRMWGAAAAGSFVVLVVLNFAWLWPVYTHSLISTPDWLDRIWFKAWI